MSVSEEESNFLRFFFLNLKIATKALKVYFDTVHPPIGLASTLANSSGTLKGLRFITKLQWHILYPNSASIVVSDNFDTTLIVCLLRNVPPRESAPVTGWDNLPHSSDTSTSADLARIKWYRNMLGHHKDGKLYPIDFMQFWGNLEGAIARLGGPELLKESQSAQHIVLDTSLTDMLKTIRICEKDVSDLQMAQDELQITCENQRSLQEKHETEIQQLQDTLQKDETVVQDFAIKIDYSRLIARSKVENEECKKKIEKNAEKIEVLKEHSLKKQNQIHKLEIKYDQHGEHLVKHDEQISTNAKEIDDIKGKQQNTDDVSNEIKRKRLEADTKALIEEDLREGTFVTIEAVKDGLLLLKQNGVLLITGYAGTGKSRISRHILHMFCTEDTSYKYIKLNELQEWENMVRRRDNVVILLDDIFGETNCIYNREKDTSFLDKVHAYVCKGNIKVIITIRDTVKRQCQEVFDSHRLFKFEFVDLSLCKYKLNEEEKKNILTIYMKTVRKSYLVNCRGFVDHNGITILRKDEISKITSENSVKGFPLVVYQFVHNEKYFQLGSTFYDRPTETAIEEVNEIRRKGEIHNGFMLQYGVMVFTAINENSVNPDDYSNITEIAKIIDAIYGKIITIKKWQVLDAVEKLKGSYLVKTPNQRLYSFHHPTLQESVILSFAQIDDENLNKILPLLSWNFFLKMVKPKAYNEKEGEVVLKIPSSSYKLLAYKLVDMFMAHYAITRWSLFRLYVYGFLDDLTDTEISQDENFVLLTYLLDAAEKKDNSDNYTEDMIQYGDRECCDIHIKNKAVFLAVLLVMLAEKENLYEMFHSIFQRINQVIRTDHNYFSVDFIKVALITSIYEISSSTDVRSVKLVSTLLDVAEENKIPVLLDQNIQSTVTLPQIQLSMWDYCVVDTACVFLSLCTVNAYQQYNLPLLEYLLSRYNDPPFDVNLFFKLFFSVDPIERLSSLSNKALKWMIEKFEDKQLIDIDFIVEIACQSQMLDTLEYLAPKSKNFNAMSCLKKILHSCSSCDEDVFNYLFSKIDITLTDLTSEILIMACKKAHFHVVKQIIEKCHNVDIQSALTACVAIRIENQWSNIDWICEENFIENRQFDIVKYIIGKYGYEQFDMKAVCQLAYQFKNFRLIERFVQNIDLDLLNVDFIRKSLLEEGELEIIVFTMNNTELSNYEKVKVLESITKLYTTDCSTKILEIVNTVWDSTDNKYELEMEEIVIAAYQSNCFSLLLWIYENCLSYISTDVKKLLMLACKDGKVDVAKWVFKAFEQKSWDTDGGKLLKLALDIDYDFCYEKEMVKRISTVNLVLTHFQIKPSDLALELTRLINIDINERNPIEMKNFDVSILEKCYHCLSTSNQEKVMSKSLDMKNYAFVNWMLENDSLFSFDRQSILNKACNDGELKTIKLLNRYFSFLDMTIAMINACISRCSPMITCLDYLWKETDHESIDKNLIVSTVCKNSVYDHVVTWILLNFQHNQIPINEVFISCCTKGHIFHVKYLLHVIDNEQLDIEEAFYYVCRRFINWNRANIEDHYMHVMLVDDLFEKLHDKTSSLSGILNELFLQNSYDLILYFLKKGYCRDSDMKSIMNQACRLGHVQLAQWILENVQHKELDVKSAFHEACNLTDVRMQLQCVALIWHYIPDMHMLDFDTVSKTITET